MISQTMCCHQHSKSNMLNFQTCIHLSQHTSRTTQSSSHSLRRFLVLLTAYTSRCSHQLKNVLPSKTARLRYCRMYWQPVHSLFSSASSILGGRGALQTVQSMILLVLIGTQILCFASSTLIESISLYIPDSYYYLADAGFGSCDMLLTPYCGVCYHLCEWAQGNQRCVS